MQVDVPWCHCVFPVDGQKRHAFVVVWWPTEEIGGGFEARPTAVMPTAAAGHFSHAVVAVGATPRFAL